jgi:hypothetical protein
MVLAQLSPMTFSMRAVLTLVLLLAAGGWDNAQSQTGASPQIFFEEAPALLITTDGDPVYRGVEGTGLERIVNTRAFIVRDSAGIHYLKVFDGWMEAYSLNGDWSVSGVAPEGGIEALRRAVGAKLVDRLDGDGSPAGTPSLARDVPRIIVSPEPAALIVTEGPARYQTVEGTSLEYLVNTTAKVFREPTDQQFYVLVGGRWFRAWATDGPWEFIRNDELPADIATWITKTRKDQGERSQ